MKYSIITSLSIEQCKERLSESTEDSTEDSDDTIEYQIDNSGGINDRDVH